MILPYLRAVLPNLGKFSVYSIKFILFGGGDALCQNTVYFTFIIWMVKYNFFSGPTGLYFKSSLVESKISQECDFR